MYIGHLADAAHARKLPPWPAAGIVDGSMPAAPQPSLPLLPGIAASPAARLAARTSPLGGTGQAGTQRGLAAPPSAAAFADLLLGQLTGTTATDGAGAPVDHLTTGEGRAIGNLPASPTSRTGSRSQRALAWARSMLGRQDWNNLCQRFIEEAYGTRNVFPSAAAAGRALPLHRGRESWRDAPPGALLYFTGDATNDYNGHAGLYLGDGRMISATPRGVQEERLDSPYYEQRYLGWADPSQLPATTPPAGGAPKVPVLPATAAHTAPSRPSTLLPPSALHPPPAAGRRGPLPPPSAPPATIQ